MTEAQLVELGKEVGLSAELLRQALAEERSRTLVPAESGHARGTHGRIGGERGAHGPGRRRAGARRARCVDAAERGARSETTVRRSARVGGAARLLLAFRRALTVSGQRSRARRRQQRDRIVADVAAGTVTCARRRRLPGTRTPARDERRGVALLVTLFVGAPLLAISIPPSLAAIPALLAGAAHDVLHLAASTRTSSTARRSRSNRRSTASSSRATSRATTAQVLLDAIIGPPRPPK